MAMQQKLKIRIEIGPGIPSQINAFRCSSFGYWHFHAARGNTIGTSVRI